MCTLVVVPAKAGTQQTPVVYWIARLRGQ